MNAGPQDRDQPISLAAYRRKVDEDRSLVRCARCDRLIPPAVVQCPECGINFRGEAADFAARSRERRRRARFVAVVALVLVVVLLLGAILRWVPAALTAPMTPIPRTGSFKGAIVVPSPSGGMPLVAEAHGAFVQSGANPQHVVLIYDRPAPGVPMQLQAGQLVQTRGGTWLPTRTGCTVICNLGELQAARVRAGGVPESLADLLIRRSQAAESAAIISLDADEHFTGP